MRTTNCKCGQLIQLDDEDYDRTVNMDEWTCSHGSNVFHHIGTGSHKVSLSLAEFILGHKPGLLVDHKDNDKHNNQKSNLRHATRAQNGANRRLNKNNKTGFKGVSYNLGKICARLGKEWLGYFNTLEGAARAYDKRAKEVHGEFALLNFPE